MGIKLTNFANTTFAENITKTTQVFSCTDLSAFPTLTGTDYFYAVGVMPSGDFEIMKVIGVNGNTLTVYRAQEGTQSQAFKAGNSIELRITAGSLQDVINETEITLPHSNADSSVIGQATDSMYGHVVVTDNIHSGADASNGVAVSPYALNVAYKEILGAAQEHLFTESQTWVVPATGTYTITCVGAGGKGGDAGNWLNDVCAGGSGGGGGAGETLTQDISLTVDDSIEITVGAIHGGTSSFGNYITARGGENGSNGADYTTGVTGCMPGVGGIAGHSYGTEATNGVLGGSQAGKGGISVDGRYGNGGNGGTYGNKGKDGIQGCVKARLKVD